MFIKISYTSQSLLVLFIKKDNSNLRFYVDYDKLNELTKKDYNSLLLIKELLARIYKSKYLIRLDITTIFNKLRIYPNRKNLIIFTILLKVYKYKVLSFR